MKRLSFLIAVLFLFVGCNEVKESFIRGSKTRRVVTINKSIPLTVSECEDREVYGESDQCGMSRNVEVCVDVRGGERVCGTERRYPTCNYTETTCHDVPAGTFKAKVKLVFDSRAKLASGQTEKYTLSGNYSNGAFRGKIDVSSRYYSYRYKSDVVLTNNTTKTIKFVKSKKPITTTSDDDNFGGFFGF